MMKVNDGIIVKPRPPLMIITVLEIMQSKNHAVIFIILF